MTTDAYIDQLAQWWEDAEKAMLAHPGDIIIEDRRDREGGYEIWPAVEEESLGKRSRILSRAPKPKPAWHDAVAVLAHQRLFGEETVPEVYVRTDEDFWESITYYAKTEELLDPVPLIEARVTDEAVLRGLEVLDSAGWLSTGTMHPESELEEADAADARRVVAGVIRDALGLDPDKENA